jgi:hypothetical protein
MATVKFDDRVWGRLATVADNRGVRIQDLLEAAVGHVLEPSVVPIIWQIRKLEELHYSTGEIARRLGVSASLVSKLRREQS